MLGDFERKVPFGQQIQMTRPRDEVKSAVVIVEGLPSGAFGALRVDESGGLLIAGSLDPDRITSIDERCWTLQEIRNGMQDAGVDPLFINGFCSKLKPNETIRIVTSRPIPV